MSIMEMKFRGGTVKDKFFFVAISIMALGQWADSKEMLTEAYVGLLSTVTNHYEYQDLNIINIGSNVEYISQVFGSPQLVKNSKYIDEISFAYYLHEKYILTLILKENRVSAYTITALTADFVPNGLLDKKASNTNVTIVDNAKNFVDFTIDYNNVEFLLVREELDKNKLFINQYFGSIGYQHDTNISSLELQKVYEVINNDEDNLWVKKQVTSLAEKAINNFYGVGELELSVIADSVLTNFEYSFYFKQ
ncbi:MAG: hypothetical protein MJK12_11685 [Colwellia sp.]|nr:hypothetical protein [Colwellia sp.]